MRSFVPTRWAPILLEVGSSQPSISSLSSLGEFSSLILSMVVQTSPLCTLPQAFHKRLILSRKSLQTPLLTKCQPPAPGFQGRHLQQHSINRNHLSTKHRIRRRPSLFGHAVQNMCPAHCHQIVHSPQ